MSGDGVPWVPIWSQATPDADVVCQHGTAADSHCCNCHHGFLFEGQECRCELDDDEDEDDGPRCESCDEPATRTTNDDVPMCEECYQVLCDEQGVTGEG